MTLSPFPFRVVSAEDDVTGVVSQLRIVVDAVQVGSDEPVDTSVCQQFNAFLHAPVDLLAGQAALHQLFLAKPSGFDGPSMRRPQDPLSGYFDIYSVANADGQIGVGQSQFRAATLFCRVFNQRDVKLAAESFQVILVVAQFGQTFFDKVEDFLLAHSGADV